MLEFTLRKSLKGPSGAFSLEVAMSVAKGEVLALYGPSGAGKTTVLRMIAGLLAADDATISLRGESWREKPPGQRKVGFVFQDYGLFPNMTVAENLAFSGGNDAVLSEVFELGQLAGRYPHQLSGGQQQRVAVARTLVQCPDVLLLDEPLSALDRPLRRQLGTYLKQAVREQQIPCLLVSHDPEEVLLLADRVVILNNGKVIEQGHPSDLLLQPATNGLVTATVLRLEGNRMLVRVGDHRVWLDYTVNGTVPGDEIQVKVG